MHIVILGINNFHSDTEIITRCVIAGLRIVDFLVALWSPDPRRWTERPECG
jgi:hypothetical protein